MQAFNQVVKKVRVGDIQHKGQKIVVSIATEITNWTRNTEIAKQQGSSFMDLVRDNLDKLKPGTKEIISRENVHASKRDKKDHVTVIEADKVHGDNEAVDGDTSHLYPKK